jgi:ElaB/YqjD/DUF883 family membrane-anchored ribosome-binding protein
MDHDPTSPSAPGATPIGGPRNGAGTDPAAQLHDGPELMQRVVQGAHATIDRLADSAAPHVQRLQASVSDANESVHERAGQARALGDEWTESLRVTVREHPLAAVGLALAAGLLIARVSR